MLCFRLYLYAVIRISFWIFLMTYNIYNIRCITYIVCLSNSMVLFPAMHRKSEVLLEISY